MNMALQFPEPPPLGTILLVGPQRYDLISMEPYQRKDGKDSTLLYWHTHCPDCNAPFIATSSLTVRDLNRRCETHKSPGKWVARKGWRRGKG